MSGIIGVIQPVSFGALQVVSFDRYYHFFLRKNKFSVENLPFLTYIFNVTRYLLAYGLIKHHTMYNMTKEQIKELKQVPFMGARDFAKRIKELKNKTEK